MKKSNYIISSNLPSAVFNGFPYVVYHWTLKKNIPSISKSGLLRGTFVTQDPRNYKGEILLGVCMDKPHDWKFTNDGTPRSEDSTWQAILTELVPPCRIFQINGRSKASSNKVKSPKLTKKSARDFLISTGIYTKKENLKKNTADNMKINLNSLNKYIQNLIKETASDYKKARKNGEYLLAFQLKSFIYSYEDVLDEIKINDRADVLADIVRIINRYRKAIKESPYIETVLDCDYRTSYLKDLAYLIKDGEFDLK